VARNGGRGQEGGCPPCFAGRGARWVEEFDMSMGCECEKEKKSIKMTKKYKSFFFFFEGGGGFGGLSRSIALEIMKMPWMECRLAGARTTRHLLVLLF